MKPNNRLPKALDLTFVGDGVETALELRNTTDQTLKCIEVLTVFLKDDETPGGASRSHIRFNSIAALQPQQKIVLPHRTWSDGKPVEASLDKLERLRHVPGKINPYVLDISWDDAEGKKQFQRIPVGN